MKKKNIKWSQHTKKKTKKKSSRDFAWFRVILRDYAWLCVIMRDFAWFCVIDFFFVFFFFPHDAVDLCLLFACCRMFGSWLKFTHTLTCFVPGVTDAFDFQPFLEKKEMASETVQDTSRLFFVMRTRGTCWFQLLILKSRMLDPRTSTPRQNKIT